MYRMEVPDRTGQVWEDADGFIILIVRKPRLTKWGDDVRIHNSLRLDDGRAWGIVEFEGRPLENGKLKRIA